MKHKKTQKYLEYFQGVNDGYQDLYQLALINDLRKGVKKMAYIIPSNFLFGFSISNKIRDDFFPYYTIRKAFIFEKKYLNLQELTSLFVFSKEKKSSKEKR